MKAMVVYKGREQGINDDTSLQWSYFSGSNISIRNARYKVFYVLCIGMLSFQDVHVLVYTVCRVCN